MGDNFILFLLLIIFLGATSADYVSRKKKGYFLKNGKSKWIIGRLVILGIVIAIWYFAIR